MNEMRGHKRRTHTRTVHGYGIWKIILFNMNIRRCLHFTSEPCVQYYKTLVKKKKLKHCFVLVTVFTCPFRLSNGRDSLVDLLISSIFFSLFGWTSETKLELNNN